MWGFKELNGFGLMLYGVLEWWVLVGIEWGLCNCCDWYLEGGGVGVL